jgi:CxxC motif-containing protein (DUF1111 family)
VGLSLAVALGVGACGDGGDGGGGLTVVREDRPDLPLAGLTAAERGRFDVGDALFDREFRPSQGLGPVYIRAACSRCHVDDGRGPGAVERAIRVSGDGFTPLDDQGPFRAGPVLRPQFVAPATRGVTAPWSVPAEGVLRSARIGPAVFGRGWFEAVPDAVIEAGARAQAEGGVLRGRVNRDATGRVGRFGLKARVATLEDFAADAFRNDMGLTSRWQPTEVPNEDGLDDDARPGLDLDDDTVRETAFYVSALAIPRRAGLSAEGAMRFAEAGCAGCHTPTLATGPAAPFAGMANTVAPLYSDLLVHDMGVGLADGTREGLAGPRDWRTAPLMGLRFFRTFLHDGRARSVEEAIVMHRQEGSEANASVAAFEALSAEARAQLLGFVSRL